MSIFPCPLSSKAGSDPFHDLLADAVASFSSSLALGETFCLDSPFASQQLPGALIPLGRQCQSSPQMEQGQETILGPSGWRFSSPLALGFMCYSYFFLLLQRSQKVSVCAQNPFPILHLLSAPIHQLGERCPTSFGESLTWECSKAGASERFFSLVSLASFFIFFFPQQPRNFCQNVFSTCSLLVMLSVLQICYQCH